MPSLSLSDPDTPKPIAKKKTKTQSLTDPDLDGVSGKKTKKRKASDLEQEPVHNQLSPPHIPVILQPHSYF